MIIHSTFHDYYDTARAHGIDPAIRYIRKTERVITPKSEYYFWQKYQGFGQHGFPVYTKSRWIGFCGRFYLWHEESHSDGKENIFWNDEALERIGQGGAQRIEKNKALLSIEDHEPFLKLDCPVFTIDRIDGEYGLYKNPCLKNYSFAKIMPPTEAFQQLSMYLGNNLAKQVDPLPLDDKHRIIAHGMDKWSFRNPDPPKRKKNNKIK